MGTGGATALLSPEIKPEAVGANLWRVTLNLFLGSRFTVFQRTADSLTSTYRKKNVIRHSLCRSIGFLPIHDYVSTIHGTLTSFVLFEIFHLSCLPFRKTRNGLTEK